MQMCKCADVQRKKKFILSRAKEYASGFRCVALLYGGDVYQQDFEIIDGAEKQAIVNLLTNGVVLF